MSMSSSRPASSPPELVVIVSASGESESGRRHDGGDSEVSFHVLTFKVPFVGGSPVLGTGG
jgi:hypothetical protein